MSKDWENSFKQWSQPPGATEEKRIKNAIYAIRNALHKSDKLNRRSIKVFVQGSYRNRVNTRNNSDVDIGVLCDDSFIPFYPEGTSKETFGNISASYLYAQFKNEVGEALVDYFGRDSVHRGNKAFDLKENSYHVEADVAPFFEYRRYLTDGNYRCGVALRPDNGGTIHNYPERLLDSWPKTPQHYENGVSKNSITHKSFKGVVRILKTLCNEMANNGISIASNIPGFLIECLVWNAENRCLSHENWDDNVQVVLRHLWTKTKNDDTCKDWFEVNGIKYLFHSTQNWTRADAHNFLNSAWDYIGVRK